MMTAGALTPTLLVITLLTLALAVALVRRRLPHDEHSLPNEIDAPLPQTQCAQCGYPGCMPYAEAVANGAAINPPSGRARTGHPTTRSCGPRRVPLSSSLLRSQK